MSVAWWSWTALSLVWGSTWLFVKIGVTDIPPLTFAWLRFAVALLPLFLIMAVRRSALPKSVKDWKICIVTGTLYFSLNYGLVYWGSVRISSGLGAILYTTMPLFGLVFAHLRIPEEQVTVPKLAGVLLGIAGVTAIFWEKLEFGSEGAFWGALAIVIASFGSAWGTIEVKLHGRSMDPLALTNGQLIVGLVPLSLIALVVEGNPIENAWTIDAILGLLYLGLMGTAFTFLLLNWLIRYMDVTKTHLIPLASTLIAVFLGWLVLNETLGLLEILGTAAILSGLVLATRKNERAVKSSS